MQRIKEIVAMRPPPEEDSVDYYTDKS